MPIPPGEAVKIHRQPDRRAAAREESSQCCASACPPATPAARGAAPSPRRRIPPDDAGAVFCDPSPMHHAVLRWRRALIAFVRARLDARACAVRHLWPVLFLTFPVLVWLSQRRTGRFGGIRAAARPAGFSASAIFGRPLLDRHAFLVDAKIFGWLLPSPSWAARRPRAFHGFRSCASAHDVDRAGLCAFWRLRSRGRLPNGLRGNLLTGFP